MYLSHTKTALLMCRLLSNTIRLKMKTPSCLDMPTLYCPYNLIYLQKKKGKKRDAFLITQLAMKWCLIYHSAFWNSQQIHLNLPAHSACFNNKNIIVMNNKLGFCQVLSFFRINLQNFLMITWTILAWFYTITSRLNQVQMLGNAKPIIHSVISLSHYELHYYCIIPFVVKFCSNMLPSWRLLNNMLLPNCYMHCHFIENCQSIRLHVPGSRQT